MSFSSDCFTSLLTFNNLIVICLGMGFCVDLFEEFLVSVVLQFLLAIILSDPFLILVLRLKLHAGPFDIVL